MLRGFQKTLHLVIIHPHESLETLQQPSKHLSGTSSYVLVAELANATRYPHGGEL